MALGFAIADDFISAKSWHSLAGVAHGFSTRHAERHRFFNRAASGQRFAGPVFVEQIHSDIVRPVERLPEAIQAGDALITATPGLALAVKTADCLPILLFDPAVPAVGAVHAGWRGTVQRIAEKAVGAMRARYGAESARMHALIGPGIHSCCYEIGEEVIEAFHSQFSYWKELFAREREENPADTLLPRQVMTVAPPGEAFSAHRGGRPPLRDLAPGRACLDLEEANRRQLLDAGLKMENIVSGAPCTACRNDLLYSYRREGAAAGRLYAVVLLC